MATVRKFAVHLVRRATTVRLATSYGQPISEREHVLVRLTGDNGCEGWGEASPLPHFTGETAAGIALVLERELLPCLVGIDALDIAAAHERMALALPTNSSSKAAADMALYDLAARSLGIAEHQLLGGAYRREVAITRPLGIDRPEITAAKARSYVEAGHRTLKMKVGVDARSDVARVRAVRDAVGPDVAIRIDANQGYDLPTAMRVARELADCSLEYFEQPIAARDHHGLAKLRADCGMRIAADESLHTVLDAVRLVEAGAADVFVIKLIKTSGLWYALQIAAVAQAAGLQCVSVSPYDTQIGAAHALQLAAAVPSITAACELTVFATQPELGNCAHILQNGALRVADAAGSGVVSIAELAGYKAPAAG